MHLKDDIVALATPSGAGAISIIRLSGDNSIKLVDPHFRSVNGKKLVKQKSHTVHLGHLVSNDRVLDKVLASTFKAPNSYTGENVVEISCHGSPYIQQQIIQLFLENGCRMAEAGEFTLRAFLNGKMDLSQAEAVADLIASENEASHQIAMNQMRGGFSSEIKNLREELLNFASLIELELDFSEEDVEFANRKEFEILLGKIEQVLKNLIDSFATGNVIKNGIPVAIIGEPNVGKSTLLNALLNDDRAIVSEIAGTTRDAIEDEVSIGGIGFRFIDTAGIRETEDVVEGIGIRKTFEKIEQAQVIIYLIDSTQLAVKDLKTIKLEIEKLEDKYPQKSCVTIVNKIDLLSIEKLEELNDKLSTAILLSAKTGKGVEKLRQRLLEFVNTGALRNNETIVTNSRHYDSLLNALESVEKVRFGMNEGLSGDLVSIDLKGALFNLGEITGEITNDELLGNIFSNFCIGK